LNQYKGIAASGLTHLLYNPCDPCSLNEENDTFNNLTSSAANGKKLMGKTSLHHSPRTLTPEPYI